MAKELYVANLDYSIDNNQLKTIFSEVGEVEQASVVLDKETKRSRGFGFVEMSKEEDVQKAIDTLNNKEVSGRKLHIELAKAPKATPFRKEEKALDFSPEPPREPNPPPGPDDLR